MKRTITTSMLSLGLALLGSVVATTPAGAAQPAERQAPCALASSRFVPTSMDVIGSRHQVIDLPATPRGTPRTPPISGRGKAQVAWDRGSARPGAAKRHALMTVHAWPDGSALGNQLHRALGEGEQIVLRGGGETACYTVTERSERPARDPKLTRLFYGKRTSEHAIAIVTCSGKRLGPGRWTHRTVWVAKPIG